MQWSNDFFDNLYKYEWELPPSPAGAQQWTPKGETERMVPDAHDPCKSHKPMMLTTDLALRMDPAYGKISKRFQENPEAFKAAFARAWYKTDPPRYAPSLALARPESP